MSSVCSLILSKFSLKLMWDSFKTQPGKNTVQLSSAWLSGNICHPDISSAECSSTAIAENLCIWTSTSVHSHPHSTLLYRKLPERMPYVYTVCCSTSFPQAFRNGLTPPRHQCRSDEWVSNSVWSSHQRHAALNAQPWEKVGRGKTS